MPISAGNAEALLRAEKQFKKQELLAQGPAAAAEYQNKQAAVLDNMQRLRALRLSRESRLPASQPPKARKTARKTAVA